MEKTMTIRTLGDYIDFDHEPSVEETASAVGMLITELMGAVRKADAVEKIETVVKDLNAEWKKQVLADPLMDMKAQPIETLGHWTMGVKIQVGYNMDNPARYGNSYHDAASNGLDAEPYRDV